MKTIHVVGFKNSGKTTLITRWVRLLKQRGDKVAVLKHHGHQSPIDFPCSETDTMQFFNGGADVSVVAGNGTVQFHLNDEPEFKRMKEIATVEKPDVLLIEGYKNEQGDKVVLLRDENDWHELQHLQGVKLLIGAADAPAGISQVASRTEGEKLDDWLLNWLGGEQ